MAELTEDDNASAATRSVAETARAVAREAAHRAGVQIRDVEDFTEFRQVCHLYRQVWMAEDGSAAVTPILLQALAHSGNYVGGAYEGDALVGACVGFLGSSPPGELHSHIAGVAAEARGRNIGFALKVHQRAWALERGIKRIGWTFDPLVRRNAYFNITKLGAVPRGYLTNFYGDMPDGINSGDESDRLFAEWRLDDVRVAAACAGRIEEPDAAALRADGAAAVLARDPAGRPVTGRSDAARLLVAVPADVEALRRADPAAAMAWRQAVREGLGGLLAEGAVVTGFARAGWYLLERRNM